MTELVSMTDVTAWYGPSQALFGVNLEIQKGEAVALMGRNGMGKTTSIRTLCSLLKPHSGNIRFEGADILKLPIHKVAQLGIGLVPEGRRCFPNLTVEENLIAAAKPGEWDIDS
ncbi:MAG: ATP-binding cassette domain-containing protein, partial [Pseudomonadota bacterium]